MDWRHQLTSIAPTDLRLAHGDKLDRWPWNLVDAKSKLGSAIGLSGEIQEPWLADGEWQPAATSLEQ